MKRRSIKFMMLAALAVPSLASAQQVTTRAQLNSILSSSVTEGFQSFSIGNGNAHILGSNVLDNSTVSPYGGPVVPGIRFSTNGSLQMNGPGYFGQASNDLEANGDNLTISFLTSTQAFGLDATNFNGFASPFVATVWGPSNALLGTMAFGGTNAPATEFVGWQDAGGIDHVDLVLTPRGWTALVDDVQFGTTATTTPEPASMVLLATGLVGVFGIARRRRNG